MLGLKRGTVELCDHQPEWEVNALEIIRQLRTLLGDAALDIQHIGSTAIRHIKAKPIIDIAVAVRSFETLDQALPRLDEIRFYRRSHNRFSNDVLYVIDDLDNDTVTHHIHFVEIDSIQWRNYVDLRDYLNENPQKAAIYETLKIDLARKHPNDRTAYTDNKAAFMETCLSEARIFAEQRFGSRLSE